RAFALRAPPAPRPPLFPYTALFRSGLVEPRPAALPLRVQARAEAHHHDQPHGDQHGGEGDRDPGGGEHRPDHHQRESDQQGVAQGAHDAREDVRALDVPARDGVVRGGLATQLLAGGAGALSGAGPAVRVALAGSVAAGVVPAVVGRGTLADVGRRVLAGPLAPRLPALVALVGSGRRARLVLAPALVDRAAGGAHIAAGT